MKCKKCGQELMEGDLFCGACGCKVDEGESIKDTPIGGSPEVQKGKKNKGLIIGGAIVLVILIGIFIVIGMQPKDIDIEAKDLGSVLYTEEEEAYYEDNLFVHGFLLRDPVDSNRYALYSDTPQDVDGVVFTFEAGLDESLGDGSELIVKGKLGYLNDAPSATLLLGEEIEVINSVERVFVLENVDELLNNSDNYIDCKVSITGYVETGGWFEPYMLNDSFTNIVNLLNLTEEQKSDMNLQLCTVTGKFVYVEGNASIEVESVEIIETEETGDEVITYFDDVNELLASAFLYIGETVSFEGWTDVLIDSYGDPVYYIANGSEPIYLLGISNAQGESLYGGYCMFTGEFDQNANAEYTLFVEHLGN